MPGTLISNLQIHNTATVKAMHLEFKSPTSPPQLDFLIMMSRYLATHAQQVLMVLVAMAVIWWMKEMSENCTGGGGYGPGIFWSHTCNSWKDEKENWWTLKV